MNKAEAEACTDQMLAALPDRLAETIGDLTIYVAGSRNDHDVLRAAMEEAGQGQVIIPRTFRAVYMGTPLAPAAADEEDADPPSGVIVLNAAMLRDEQDLLDTLLHEIGHALGYDEAGVSALGLE